MLRLSFLLLLTAFLAAPSAHALAAPHDPPRALLARVEAALADGRSDALTDAPYASLAPAVAAALNEDHTLTASDAAASDEFGYAVALDGDRALVGAYRNDDSGSSSGSAYVFEYDGTAWVEVARLTASDAAGGDAFGYAVALDGDRALIGAPYQERTAFVGDAGAAYVFEYNGTTWDEVALLIDPDAEALDQLGAAVALSGDRALVGTPTDNHAVTDAGTVHVFAFDGATWARETELIASDPTMNAGFGGSIAFDGSRALIGAAGADDGAGAAYVFAFDGTTWDEEARLTASDAAEDDLFGRAVALDGDRALVGAPNDNFGVLSNVGAAYVFAFDGTAWDEEAKLTPAERTSNDEFGLAVALSGGRALVGAYRDDEAVPTSTGAAYVFAFDGTAWNEEARLTASDAAQGDQLGWAVALSGDRALAGAIGDDREGATNLGAVYVFDLDPVQPATASTGPVDEAGNPVPEPVAVPLEGQTEVDYAGTVGNLGPGPLTLDGWPVITMPDGSMVVRRRPTVYTLGGGDTQDYTGAFNMLASFNPGTYTFTYHTGDHPDDTWASDSFDLVKSGLELPPIPEEKAGAAHGGTMAAHAVSRLGDEAWVAVGPGEDVAAVLAAAETVAERAPEAASEPAARLAHTALGAAYPNPFNPVATVPFRVAQAGAVRLTVYDVLGREVARLVDGHAEAGAHTARFDASALPSGTYLVRFTAAGQAHTQRITLLK